MSNNKKNSIIISGAFSILLIVLMSACSSNNYVFKAGNYQQEVKSKKSGNRGFYYISNRTKRSNFDRSKAINLNNNISSVSDEESLFLEDIEINLKEDSSSNNIPDGRKFFTRNNLTTQIYAFDRLDLMGELGQCRARAETLKKDLEDDGIVNNSAGSVCVPKPRTFQKGAMSFTEKAYSQLEEWAGDDFTDALYAFLQSCRGFTKDKPVASKTITIGNTADWRTLCTIGASYYQIQQPKAFFERYFAPFQVKNSNGKDDSKFTGYYVWELAISMKKTDEYKYPIYSLPPECKTNSSSYCPSRAEINAGALEGRGLELAWAKNPMDIYFMQVQGSGVGVTEDGQSIRFNYAGKNGQKFKTYSEYIKSNPGFCPVSGYFNQIAWLNKNPTQALQATSVCDSYVFFEKKSGLDPVLGGQGTPLTQSRSIAIDPTYIPYGVPMWIETHITVADIDNRDNDRWIDWNRLYIAQDTGSAIKGVVRADLYMGHGKKGEYIAKNQNFTGRWYMLIPNFLVSQVS